MSEECIGQVWEDTLDRSVYIVLGRDAEEGEWRAVCVDKGLSRQREGSVMTITDLWFGSTWSKRIA